MTKHEKTAAIRELTDSELDLASGGTSNDVKTFVAAVQSLTAVALDALGPGYKIATDGVAAFQQHPSRN